VGKVETAVGSRVSRRVLVSILPSPRTPVINSVFRRPGNPLLLIWVLLPPGLDAFRILNNLHLNSAQERGREREREKWTRRAVRGKLN